MAKFYPQMRKTADKLIKKYGMEFDLLRKGKIKVVNGIEYYDPNSSFKATGVKTDYRADEIDGQLILAGDIRIVFTGETEIKVGDVVTVDNDKYRVISNNPSKPAETLICYRAQLRK
ncbi:hypothetical protein CKY10_22405 [Photorhabdus sp. HUG-39]|uniref:Phage protein n=1 Tax=Photorhabdus kayaii TaxID=230088 RepID=A0ABX0B6H0_9GAMM|nr:MULTISPECIES: hypothetical protein [Photorhabdus]MCC8375785.1 hypothetical protein [Photorhabdus bodei]NDL14344.1 hypothetical protein [Photorhabdus kayaii]NDL27861.1 hypothetical protein [Photorhabdus kayaii]RAX06526.1 hypothetical protein CKY10_22405 [Photorhabdus sp. HUG-39]